MTPTNKLTILTILLFSQVFLCSCARRIPTTHIEKLNARIEKDVIKYNTDEQYLKRASSLIESDTDFYTEHRVRNLVERDNTPVVTTNTLAFTHLQCVSDTTCWAVTSSGKLYKSSDSMASWALQSTPASVLLSVVIVSPYSNDYIYVAGNGTSCITSTDGGNTWTVVIQSIYPIHIRPHPNDPTHAAAYNLFDGGLYISTNFFASWTQYAPSPIYDLAWCNNANNGVMNYDLCYITTQSVNGHNLRRFAVSDIDKSETRYPLNATAYYMLEHPKYLFVIADADVDGVERTLYVSTDNGTSFDRSLLPHGDGIEILEETQLLDDRNQIFLAALDGHTSAGVRPGAIYVGDADGFKFSEALTKVVSKNDWWDFDTVRSLEGTYLSNIFLSYEDYGDGNFEYYLQTLITFDNGAQWNTLETPQYFYNGSEFVCQPVDQGQPCTLNLFGRTTWLGIGGDGYFGDFWSAETAVGLILATGNANDHLLFEQEYVNTYLSNDGGVHWLEVAEHSSVYDFGDHGGVICMVANQVPTTYLYYSLDFGASWTAYQFTTRPVVVVNLFTSSSVRSVFNIFAARSGSSVYFGVDFSNINDQVCTAKDFERWELADEAGQNCLLGHETVYQRRKATSLCDVPDDFNPILSQNNCDCTIDDYECDTNYVPSFYDQTVCTLLPGYVPEDITGCLANNSKLISGGYRKTPGDTCVNDIDGLLYTWAPCDYSLSSGGLPPASVNGNPKKSLSTGAVIGIVLLVLLVVAGAIVAGIVVGRRSAFCKDNFPFLKTPDRFEVGYSNQLQMNDDEL